MSNRKKLPGGPLPRPARERDDEKKDCEAVPALGRAWDLLARLQGVASRLERLSFALAGGGAPGPGEGCRPHSLVSLLAESQAVLTYAESVLSRIERRFDGSDQGAEGDGGQGRCPDEGEHCAD